MKRGTMTITLPGRLRRQLDSHARRAGLSRSDVVQRSLADYLFFRELDELCAKVTAHARAQGLYTEEDVQRRLDEK